MWKKKIKFADSSLGSDITGRCTVWVDTYALLLMCMAAMSISPQRAISVRSDLTT